MSKSITFSSADRSEFHASIQQYMGIKDVSVRNQIIDMIEEAGAIRRFGYGSLINKPEITPDSKYNASIPGWKKGYVCKDNTYRGTPENPGLTLGLDASDDPNATILGAILENKLDEANAKATVLEWIKAYGDREYPSGMPIYSFKVLEVTAENGVKIPAVVCVADDKGPLYVGNKLTLEEKAAIIATAIASPDRNPNTKKGEDPKAGFLTDFQYIINDVNNSVKEGKPVDPDVAKLLELAKAYRASMPTQERTALEAYEVTEGRDPSLYAAPVSIPEEYTLDTASYLLDARQKLGNAVLEPTQP